MSLLLVVVIRSSVRHLNARLSYMRYFMFIDDVENGEVGYALSTFEAVLSYLSRDPGLLRRASKLNRRLWDAAKDGNVSEIKQILAINSRRDAVDDGEIETRDTMNKGKQNGILRNGSFTAEPAGFDAPDVEQDESRRVEHANGSLSHVFPFQRPISPDHWEPPVKKRKRVSVASYSC